MKDALELIGVCLLGVVAVVFGLLMIVLTFAFYGVIFGAIVGAGVLVFKAIMAIAGAA